MREAQGELRVAVLRQRALEAVGEQLVSEVSKYVRTYVRKSVSN